MSEAKALIVRLSSLFTDHGIDIIHPFDLACYNNYLPKEAASIPSTIPNAMALLIGNTKLLWPHFIKYMADNPSLIDTEQPLDTYIEHNIQSALNTISVLKYRVFYSHIPVNQCCYQDGGGGGDYYYVAMQHCAQASGLAYLDPASHISLHPDYGPWFALRAVVVFDSVQYSIIDNNATQQQQPPHPRPPILKCPMSPKTEQYVKMLFESALKEQNTTGDGEGKRYRRAHWEKWVAVREATSSRHANKWRYSPSQLKYHYTSDKKVLMEEIDRWLEQRKMSV